jgi:hypothetical protein
MAAIEGGPDVPPFHLDTDELTLERYRQLRGVRPFLMPPTARRTAPDSSSVAHVEYEDALAIAEKLGKRLPTRGEYLTAYAHLRADRAHGDERTSTTPPVLRLRSGLKEWTTSWYAAWVEGPPLFEDLVVKPSRFIIVEGGTPPKPVAPELAWLFRGLPPPEFQEVSLGTAEVGLRCARSAHPRFLSPR